MASCLHVAMNASNKWSRKAKHSGKENFDVATDRDDMDDFLPQKKQGLECWMWTFIRILAKCSCAADFATAVNIIIFLPCQYDYLPCS